MGADANNHNYGADVQIGRPLKWRFSIGNGQLRRHDCSPGIEPRMAIRAALALAAGQLALARTCWGFDVCAWLDDQIETEKAALLEAARSVGEGVALAVRDGWL